MYYYFMNNTEQIVVKSSVKEHPMQKVEYARWLCLVEALDLIERKAVDLKQDLTSDDFWVKPLAFQKYIEQRLETMILDVNREEGLTGIPPIVTTEQIEPSVAVEVEADEEPTEEELAAAAAVQ
jgi:hypothetical protein